MQHFLFNVCQWKICWKWIFSGNWFSSAGHVGVQLLPCAYTPCIIISVLSWSSHEKLLWLWEIKFFFCLWFFCTVLSPHYSTQPRLQYTEITLQTLSAGLKPTGKLNAIRICRQTLFSDAICLTAPFLFWCIKNPGNKTNTLSFSSSL